MISNYKLSIITPLYNKWPWTEQYLKDILQLDKSTHQIIIIDNASTDETEKDIQPYLQNENVFYVRNNENLGFGKACNLGYSKALADIVMFLNNDIKVKDRKSDWTDIVINAVEEFQHFLVGPTGGYIDPKTFQFCYETKDPNKNINYMSGWCLGAKKQLFDELIEKNAKGPFSEDFFCYFEDTDLSFRAAHDLYLSFKLIEIPVVHYGKVSSSQLNVNKLYNEAKQIFTNKWKNKIKKR